MSEHLEIKTYEAIIFSFAKTPSLTYYAVVFSIEV